MIPATPDPITWESIAAIASAFSALFAALAVVFLYFQTKQTSIIQRENEERLIKVQEQENEISKVRNRIYINQMYNEFNLLVATNAEKFAPTLINHGFGDLEPDLLRRLYLQFFIINLIESSWRLSKIDGIQPAVHNATIRDQAIILSKDKEATRLALSGRGYAKDFLKELWPLIFGNDSIPV